MPTLAHPVAALQTLRDDLSLRAPLELASGRRASALVIQRMLHERCASLAGGSASPAELQVLACWDETLTALEAARGVRGPDAALAAASGPLGRQLDWAVKLRILDAWRVRAGVGWGDPRLRLLDLAYHELHPSRGLTATLSRTAQREELVDARAVEAARTTPPATTRAVLRGQLCEAARAAGAGFGVNWDRFALTSIGGRPLPTPLELRTPDPFTVDAAAAEDVLRLLRSPPGPDSGGG